MTVHIRNAGDGVDGVANSGAPKAWPPVERFSDLVDEDRVRIDDPPAFLGNQVCAGKAQKGAARFLARIAGFLRRRHRHVDEGLQRFLGFGHAVGVGFGHAGIVARRARTRKRKKPAAAGAGRALRQTRGMVRR